MGKTVDVRDNRVTIKGHVVIVKTGYVCDKCGREDFVSVRPYEGPSSIEDVHRGVLGRRYKNLPDEDYLVTRRSMPCGCHSTES